MWIVAACSVLLLFVARCLFVVCCVLCVERCSLFVCVLSVVCCLLSDARCLLFVALECCSLRAAS